jgi:hypothetical protein
MVLLLGLVVFSRSARFGTESQYFDTKSTCFVCDDDGYFDAIAELSAYAGDYDFGMNRKI